MTPLLDGLKDAKEIMEADTVAHLTGRMRQLADKALKEADFMESVVKQVCQHL